MRFSPITALSGGVALVIGGRINLINRFEIFRQRNFLRFLPAAFFISLG